MGKVYHYLAETASTNTFAANLLATENVIEGTLIVTTNQTNGRGYSGNSWISEAGKNLLFSIILKPVFLQSRQQFYLNQVITLGLHDALKTKLGNALKIKWPNDIYYKDEKVAGILIENTLNGNFIQHAIIGIGLNVNQTNFPKGIGNPTSLKQASGNEWDLPKLLENICSKMEARYLQLKNNQWHLLQKDYMNALYRIEEEYYYKSGGKKFKAKIVGLNPEGKLILETNGGWKPYNFKEVEFVI